MTDDQLPNPPELADALALAIFATLDCALITANPEFKRRRQAQRTRRCPRADVHR